MLSQVDPKDKYPIIRDVTKIVRCKAPDPDDKYRKEKQFLYYYEHWHGRDWLGRPIEPVTDHVEGGYKRPIVEHRYDKYGDIIDGRDKIMGHDKVFYIPFSKEAVDKNNIIFCFMGDHGRRCDEYAYYQFVNNPWNLMQEMMSGNGGPRM